MSQETANNKFGLPKPDFQNIPQKRSISPTVIAVIFASLSGIAQVFYHTYFIKRHNNTADGPTSAQTVDPLDQIDQTHPSNHTLSHPLETTSIQNNKDIIANEEEKADEEASNKEKFEYPKQCKKKENIQAVQQQLEKARQYAKPLIKPGTYQELHGPQGIYHLVIVNHLDKRTAIKTVQQLIKQNLGVCLILPRKGEKYYRVTIAHSRTQHEANEKLKQLQPAYKNIFILKY